MFTIATPNCAFADSLSSFSLLDASLRALFGRVTHGGDAIEMR